MRSSSCIHQCLLEGLRTAGLPEAAIQLVTTPERAAVGHMLADMREFIDVLVPRGGKELIARVQREAVVLHFLEEMSYEEISRVMDCNVGTVRSRIFYGKLALKQAMENKSYESKSNQSAPRPS